MESGVVTLMLALLRSELSGEPLTARERQLYRPELLPELVSLAKKHDLTHLVVHGLYQNGFSGPEEKTHQQQYLKAVYCVVQMDYALEQLCHALEAAQIPFLPLKGSVLRRHYPEPWMRTSCDIDVLVKREDVDKAAQYLISTLQYRMECKGSHDISLFSRDGVHIELHYDLIEEGSANQASQVLNGVWDLAAAADGWNYRFEMPAPFFYFYHIAHMAKHFEGGGCGVRPLLDLWILERLPSIDRGAERELLKKGGLLRFAQCAEKLSRVWFGAEAHDDVTRRMEVYILHGGVYGTAENRLLIRQQRSGGKVKYLLSRIFMPYEELKEQYPILQRHRWLLPVMEVRRWCKIIFVGKMKKANRELSMSTLVSKQKTEETARFLADIGL